MFHKHVKLLNRKDYLRFPNDSIHDNQYHDIPESRYTHI